jgi:hypothetical protein
VPRTRAKLVSRFVLLHYLVSAAVYAQRRNTIDPDYRYLSTLFLDFIDLFDVQFAPGGLPCTFLRAFS